MLHERLTTDCCSEISAIKHRALAQVTASTLYCEVVIMFTLPESPKWLTKTSYDNWYTVSWYTLAFGEVVGIIVKVAKRLPPVYSVNQKYTWRTFDHNFDKYIWYAGPFRYVAYALSPLSRQVRSATESCGVDWVLLTVYTRSAPAAAPYCQIPEEILYTS